MNRVLKYRPIISGFALIEALIAVVVLAVGMLALTALQAALVRSSADSKARSQVAAYASGEMERIRSGILVSSKNATVVNATQCVPIAIANDISCAAWAAGLSTLSQSASEATYYADSAGSFATTNTNTGKNASFRRVTLDMGWTDATGGSRTLSITTDISPLTQGSSKVLVDRAPNDDASMKPIVRNVNPVSEGMIPIALGDGQDTAATNPKPVLVGKKNDTLVADTRFEVLTYNPTDNLGNPAFARFNKRIETAVVGCTCQSGSAGFSTTGSDSAFDTFLASAAFRPSYWDGESYVEPARLAGGVTSSPADVSQSPLCDVCCRDHRDPEPAALVLYKPWPRGTETAHGHYRIDTAGNFVVADSGIYLESCRVIRVNGMWRVTPDPRLDDLSLVATQAAATSPLVSAVGKESYGKYLFDFIKKRFVDSEAKNSNFDDASRYAMQGDAGLNDPEKLEITSVTGDKRWLHTRGVLVDYLVPTALARVNRAIANCPTGVTAEKRAQCVLPFLPFTTINVTELARWAGQSSSITGLTPTGVPATDSINYGQARMRRHSSAVALSPSVSPDDDAARLYDEQLTVLLNSVRTGVWLRVSDAAGVVFGDPTQPTRGAVTVAGNTRFNVNWSGVVAADDSEKANDPELFVVTGDATEVDCVKATSRGTSNPYACTTGSSSDVKLALALFNRKVQTVRPTITNPCNAAGPKVLPRATCLAHSLAGVTIDSVASAAALGSYTLVAGTVGKPSEKRTLTLPSVRTTAPNSVITLSFTSTTTNATAICESNTFVEWSCN